MNIDVKERTVYTSMSAEGSTAIKEAAWATTTGHSPYSFERYAKTPGGTGVGRIDDPRNWEVRAFIFDNYMFNEQKVWPVLKEFFIYALDKAWMIHLPAPYQYVPWQPWVKSYSGESATGRGEYMGHPRYLWIDQALKKQMGF